MFTASSLPTSHVLRAQLGWVLVAGLIAAGVSGLAAAIAAAYGATVALAVTALLIWREIQAVRHPEWDQHRLMKRFIRVAIERLVLLVGMLGLAFGLFDLSPMPLLLGLVGAQFAWLALALGDRRSLR